MDNKNADTAYASFDTAFVQSDTMIEFKEKLIAKNNLSPSYSTENNKVANQINSRLNNILGSTCASKKDKMEKNIDELISIYNPEILNQTHKNLINSQYPKPEANINYEKFNQMQPVTSGNSTFTIVLVIIVIIIVLYFLYKFLTKPKMQ